MALQLSKTSAHGMDAMYHRIESYHVYQGRAGEPVIDVRIFGYANKAARDADKADGYAYLAAVAQYETDLAQWQTDEAAYQADPDTNPHPGAQPPRPVEGARLEPLTVKDVRVTGLTDPRAALYPKIKLASEWAGASDVIE